MPLNHCLTSRTSANGDSAGMAAGAGADQDQAVDALLGGFARMLDVDDVVEHHAAIGMRGLDDLDGGRSEVMMIGTLCFTQVSMSFISRSLEAWQIWLTAKGATFLLGMLRLVLAELVLDAVSHSSSFSTGPAFSAGNEPTMPALHWAITSSGPETMNSGEPTTGSSSELASEAGNGMRSLPFENARPALAERVI